MNFKFEILCIQASDQEEIDQQSDFFKSGIDIERIYEN
jgi:hypothetical protein